MAINKKLIHFKTFNNFNSLKLSANEENTKYTIGINGEIQEGSPDILYQSIVYIKDVQYQWTHGLLYDSSLLDTKILYYPSEDLLPEEMLDNVLYIVGQDIYNLTVETLKPYDITDSSAKLEGRIVFDGNLDILELGFKYGTSENNLNNTIDCSLNNNVFLATVSELNSSTTYYVKAYAANEKDTYYGLTFVFTTLPTEGLDNNFEWVDLGLPSGTLWATCNVGATKPEEYGDYYAWGETVTKSDYSIETSSTYEEPIDEIEDVSNVVKIKQGGNWDIPTYYQVQELRLKCSWFAGTVNNVIVMKVTGPNGNVIYIPCNGYFKGTNLYDTTHIGKYWCKTSVIKSTTPNIMSDSLLFNISNNLVLNLTQDRYLGLGIRPVINKTI